jgi:hypothetical protein
MVLEPALKRIRLNDVALTPFRVDLSKASDAILTEILRAISESAVIVADITATGILNNRPVRNANVLYEVGIAHAVRRPEEVVLFRSDDDPLNFDIQGVRIHAYNPDEDHKGAENVVAETVIESLRSVESTRRVAIQSAAQRLTLGAYTMLLEARQGGTIQHPPLRTMGQVLSGFHRTGAIELLLELGALEARPMKVTSTLLDKAESEPESDAPLLHYALSAFGEVLVSYVIDEIAPKDPALIARMSEIFAQMERQK